MNIIYFEKVLSDYVRRSLAKRDQINKFRDPRRVEITNSIRLSKEQKDQIDELYLKNYGEKIPYTWHQHYTAFTGLFDLYYFPELIYIPEFEYFENLWPEYYKVFADKNILPIFANAYGVKTPDCILSCTKGLYKNQQNKVLTKQNSIDMLSNIGEVFIKPTVDSSSGNGCFIASFTNGVDDISGNSVEQIIDKLGMDFVIQEKVHCHSCISKIYPNSVNTFRVMTYRWQDRIEISPVTMRMGSGGAIVDNVHSGGYCISVDKNGVLSKYAFTEFAYRIDHHPDTQTKFQGHIIQNFEKMINAAYIMHTAFPQLGLVQWDFTIDESGNPVLIEANTRGTSIQLIERCLGCGPFGEKTPEILRWIRLMKKTPVNERSKYAFGNF